MESKDMSGGFEVLTTVMMLMLFWVVTPMYLALRMETVCFSGMLVST
jgi:hypothetical protein